MNATNTSQAKAVSRDLLPVEGGDLPITIARGAGLGAAVVIMPPAFGIAPDLEAQMMELADEASVAVALDPFFRDDPGLAPYDDMTRVRRRLAALDRARTYGDLRVAIDWARAEAGGRPVVVLGICFGGPFALLAAADGLASGVVTWHGTWMDQALGRASEMRCPMRLHFGDRDPFVPAEVVSAVQAAFADRPDVRIVVHEGATHGFSHRGAVKAYDERAERAGMESVRELIREVGAAG